MRILVIEDDDAVQAALRRALTLAGYEVLLAGDGEDGLLQVETAVPDALVLDLGLPRVDGMDVCRALRTTGNRLPILMLTARDAIEDRVAGLEAGADDYLVKPVGLAELRSRVRAALRRVGCNSDSGLLRAGSLELDPGARSVRVGTAMLGLTSSEFAVLEALLVAGGNVRSRWQLVHAIFGDDAYRDPRAVDVHVHHLREKVAEAGGDPGVIVTVRGAGYRLGP
jgi:two-component system response regulator MprA